MRLCFVNTGYDGKGKVAAQRYLGVFCGVHSVDSAECNGEWNRECNRECNGACNRECNGGCNG